jgi:TrmH RNA methyltransferase
VGVDAAGVTTRRPPSRPFSSTAPRAPAGGRDGRAPRAEDRGRSARGAARVDDDRFDDDRFDDDRFDDDRSDDGSSADRAHRDVRGAHTGHDDDHPFARGRGDQGQRRSSGASTATSSSRPGRDRDQNDREHKVAGQNACRALFLRRPDDIRRVYVTEQTLPLFKDVLKACAERRIAYHVKTDDDLDQIAETVHHDGVLFLARRQTEGDVDALLAWVDRLHPAQRAVLVLLQGVKNPHNLGAILRVCAHFGVPFCLRAGDTAELSPAAMRTAEGGAEFTRVVDVGDGADVLSALRGRGFSVLATSSHATLGLGRSPLPPRVVVLFGSEGEGLSRSLLALADDTIAIPGSGALESLNVACASSVVLWELWKQPSNARVPATAPADRVGTDDAGHARRPPPSSRPGARHASSPQPRVPPLDPRPRGGRGGGKPRPGRGV